MPSGVVVRNNLVTERCSNYTKSSVRSDSQCRWCARHRTERVGDHHGVCAGLARLNPRDGVAGTVSSADRLAVEEPLVTQGCDAPCYHAESGASTSSNRLALRLSHDRRRSPIKKESSRLVVCRQDIQV